jgi:hypothetical protein
MMEAVSSSETSINEEVWANYLAREQPLRAARNGRGGNLGQAMLKTFISGFSSGQQ